MYRVLQEIDKNSVVGFPSHDDPKPGVEDAKDGTSGETVPLTKEEEKNDTPTDPFFRLCKVKDR